MAGRRLQLSRPHGHALAVRGCKVARRAVLVAALCAVAAPALAVAAPGIAADAPPRLDRVERFLQDATGEGGYTGAVAVVLHEGKVVHASQHGWQDLRHTRPMQHDSIFRMYSMTKPVVSVAALMLLDEGRLQLDDPVAAYLPEFAALQRWDAGTEGTPQLRPVHTVLTVRHLLTHTSGLTTGGEQAPALVALYRQQAVDQALDLADYSRRLAQVPLAAEPGTRFKYDASSTEILSRLVEVVAQQPLQRFLQQRVFNPLQMRDTAFEVAVDQRRRVVDLDRMGADGQLVLADEAHARQPGIALRRWSSGAGGLYSTADDYARFVGMLLGGGQHDGVRLLKASTVALMMQNHLQYLALPKPVTEFSDAEGFGLGGSVLLDPAGKGRTASVGSFGWSGAASTYFSIDPARRLAAVLLLQHLPGGENDLPRISTRFYDLVDEVVAP